MASDERFLNELFELSKAIRFCQQDEICGEGITFVQFNIINLISVRKSMGMSELHEVLSVEKSTTTRLIEPLVRKQLVIKEKNSDDSRAVELRLTEEGQAVRDRAWDCLKGFISDVESRLPEDRRKEIHECIRIYAAALQNSCCGSHCCC